MLDFFDGIPVPTCMILSHTWEEDDVRHEDISSGQFGQAVPTGMHGNTKIKQSCSQA
jgi:hypothetical protein